MMNSHNLSLTVSPRREKLSEIVSLLDVILSLAEVSQRPGFVRPEYVSCALKLTFSLFVSQMFY